MRSSLVINILVCTHNVGSPVMFSIGFKTNVFYSPNNPSRGMSVQIFCFYTPCGSPKNN